MNDFYYLNDIEKQQLEKMLENPTLVEAVRKVILSGVYFDGILDAGQPSNPLKNFMLGKLSQPQALMNDDKHLGALARSTIDAISMVETGFSELQKFKKVDTKAEDKKNKAR